MNILFLTHRLPYALNRGDRIRAYYLLREMARFADVSLFSLVHDAEEVGAASRMPFAAAVRTARVTPLRNRLAGAIRLPTARPLTFSLLDAPGADEAIQSLVARRRPDLVVAFCSSMARFALSPPLERVPMVLDMVDVDSAKWRQLSTRAAWPLGWIYRREADTLARFETDAAHRAASTLVVTDRERTELLALAPRARVHVIESGISLEDYAPAGPPATAPQVVFTGVMSYRPNEQAVRWFAREVWPRVRATRPDARFVIVGAAPGRAVRELTNRDSSIEVVGAVPRVQPYLWQSAVAVAPLQVARGLQNKVLEGLAAGLPVVVTSVVMEGLPPAARAGCLVADSPVDLAETVLRLLELPPHERRRIAAAADLSLLTWTSRLAPLERILTEASAPPPRT